MHPWDIRIREQDMEAHTIKCLRYVHLHRIIHKRAWLREPVMQCKETCYQKYRGFSRCKQSLFDGKKMKYVVLRVASQARRRGQPSSMWFVWSVHFPRCSFHYLHVEHRDQKSLLRATAWTDIWTAAEEIMSLCLCNRPWPEIVRACACVLHWTICRNVISSVMFAKVQITKRKLLMRHPLPRGTSDKHVPKRVTSWLPQTKILTSRIPLLHQQSIWVTFWRGRWGWVIVPHGAPTKSHRSVSPPYLLSAINMDADSISKESYPRRWPFAQLPPFGNYPHY